VLDFLNVIYLFGLVSKKDRSLVRNIVLSKLLREKMLFFLSFQEGGEVGFSRLTKFDSHKVYISCI